MREVAKFSDCFVCGDNNDCGLKAKFFIREDGSVVSSYRVEERFVGYSGVLHGGVLAALLDEVMIKTIFVNRILAVTAEMQVKFRKPVQVGQIVQLTGRKVNQRGKVYWTEATAMVEGEEVASSKGTYIEPRGTLVDVLRNSLE